MTNRRQFLQFLAVAPMAAAGASILSASPAARRRQFTMDLRPGSIGVKGDQRKIIELAAQYGFESVEPNVNALATMADGELDELLGLLKQKRLVWGGAGMPVDFRGEDDAFRTGLRDLPKAAQGAARAGVTRMSTWLSPGHDTLTYRENFRRHVERLGPVAEILGESGISFGLEYVGPKTSWTKSRYPFVHTMREARELIAEIGHKNVGLVLDSWHWYTAGETRDDLLSLQAADVVACDLNDAPKGRDVDEQLDLERELPAATGVIDLKTFLGALVEIGYDGPVRAEPFYAPLRKMSADEAVATTAAAMKKAFALVE